MKAYKIKTDVANGFGIYVAENAGKAKSIVVNEMGECYRKATYAWVTSCVRAPEFDYLAEKGYSGCIAWSHDGERWQIDRGHWWYGDDVAPKTVCVPSFADEASS